jgi:hypothetical protein
MMSGKFLSGVRRMAAVQKENLRLILEDGGSSYSSFRIKPRYKFRTEGDVVYADDQILLESVEVAGHTAGGSVAEYNPGVPLNEANLSETDSGWTIQQYCRITPPEREFVKVGNRLCMRFYHPEAKAFLTASTNPAKYGAQPYLRRMVNSEVSDPINQSSKGVWYFEFLHATTGGVCLWESVMRIRHAATGRYLAVKNDLELSKDGEAQFQATLVDSPTRETEFRFQPIAAQSEKKMVLEDLSVRVFHKFAKPFSVAGKSVDTCWLHYTALNKPNLKHRKWVPAQMPPSLTVMFTEKQYSEDPFDIVAVAPLDVYNIEMVRAIKPVIERYIAAVHAKQEIDDPTARCTEMALTKAIYFHTITAEDDIGMDAMDIDGPPRSNCQNTSRELKLLDGLFPMLQTPVNVGMRLSKLLPDMARCHALTFKAIMQTVADNRRSEIYFATHSTETRTPGMTQSWINATIFQVGEITAAAECLNTILSNNKMLLDQYVDDTTINKFIELIGDQGPHKRFMEFFKAICSCQGNQIISNQELCLVRLFLDEDQRKKLMLTTRTMGQLEEKQKWKSLSDDDFRKKNPGKQPDHGEFLGKLQWQDGFDPVYVSWFCDDNWKMGMDQLFHSPKKLAIDFLSDFNKSPDQWAPIDKLCWVLDPAALYDKVFPEVGQGESKDASELSQFWWYGARDKLRQGTAPDDVLAIFNEQKQLSMYYEAQIDLYSEMCLDRSYNNIGTLEQHFPYEMLVSLMVNDKLPDQIRASMTLLLMRLWVDRFPHGQLRAPNPVQVLSQIALKNLDDGDALPQYTVDPKGPLSHETDKFFNFGVDPTEHASNKFHLIEDFISDYLLALEGCQVAKEKEKNIFTLAVLTILQKLVNFGFYGSRAEIVDLCNPMIATLDGRADKIFRHSPEGDDARKIFDDYTSLVMDSKRQMINSLYAICSLRDDFRLSIIMYEFKSSVDKNVPLLAQDQLKPDKWILVDQFQDAFNNVFEAGGEIDGTALDLDAMSDSPLSTILMDLMMYKNPELFEASLSLLETIFSQRVAIIEAMDGVQLLLQETVPTFETLETMMAELGTLRNYVESYETWGVQNSFSPIDRTKYQTVLDSLDKLSVMCYQAPATVLDPAAEEMVAPGQPRTKPTREWQDLMRNLDIHSLLIRAVEIPFNMFKVDDMPMGGGGYGAIAPSQDQIDKNESYKVLISVATAAWKMALSFVKGNKQNQAIFYEMRDFMVEQMKGAPELGIQNIIIEVFRDNLKVVEAAEESLFHTFADLLGKSNYSLDYLEFFEVMVNVKNFGIVQASQRKIIRALNEPALKDDRGVSKVLLLEPPMVDPTGQLTQYYLRLMKLLEACCRNRNTGATAQMQKLMSAQSIIKQAHAAGFEREQDLFTKTIFTQLMTSAYFDTPLVDISLRADATVWQYMVKIAELVQAVGADDDHPARLFIRDAGVPMVDAFFKNIYAEQGYSEEICGLRELLSMHLERLVNDAMLDTSIRRFAFHTLHLASPERYEKLDEKIKAVLNKDDTTVQIGRKRSSWSQLLSGQASSLVQKPPLYYKLFSEVAQTDHGLIEDSDGGTEMDALVRVIENVENATDPANADWLAKREKGDIGAMADGRPPDGKITFKKLADRMIDHVAENLNRDIFSGYDTISVNTTVLKMMTMVLEKKLQAVQVAERTPGKPADIVAARAALTAKQIEISDFGAAALVLDVISAPVPERLVLQAFKLGEVLLVFGNPHVQQSMWDHLNAKPSDLFFIACKKFMQVEAKKIVDNRSLRAKNIELDDDTERFGWHLVEFLRLTCEGHFMPMQDMLREQEKNKKSINLLNETVEYLVAVAREASVLRGMDEDELQMVAIVVDFLVETLQGPCPGNQEFLGSTLIVDIGKRTLTAKIFKAGHNQSLTVSVVRSAVCQLFSAMMEGPEKPSVKQAIAEKLDLDLFKTFVQEINKVCVALEGKIADKSLEPEERADAAEEHKNMLSCGYELFCVYQQLATSDRALEKGIIPASDTEPETLKYQEAYRYLTSKIKRLEFMWCEPLQMDITYFPLCPQSAALTAPSKDRLKEAVDLSTPDGKKRDFLIKGQALVDEMFYLYRLQQFPPFFWLQNLYPTLQIGVFAMVILLNFLLAVTVKGPGNMGRAGDCGDDGRRRLEEGGPLPASCNEYEYGDDIITMRPNAKNSPIGISAEWLVRLLCFIIIGMYGACLAYLLISRVPLIRSERTRKQEDILSQATKAAGGKVPTQLYGLAGFGKWSVLGTYFAALAFYGLFGLMLWIEYGDAVYGVIDGEFNPNLGIEYREFGCVMFGLWMIVILNEFFQNSIHFIAHAYCSTFTIITEKNTLATGVFFAFMMLGTTMQRFYFLTIPLLNLVTLSERLQNVIKAVIIPMADLVVVFILMIFVIFIFASFGMYFFGEQMQTWSDDMAFYGDINATTGEVEGTVSYKTGFSTCKNLALCFFNTLDQGLRTGDLSGNAMDTVTWEGGLVYADRVLFGLVFFLFLGVILFDIVTGIIIDTFGALREETATRLDYLRDTAFISDIERSEYEENGPEFKFEKLDKEDQDMWNYVFYIAHLRIKDPMLYTGAESEIYRKMKEKDTSWFPAGSSWALQVSRQNDGGGDEEDSADAILMMLEALKTEVVSVKGITQQVFEAAALKK